MDPTTNGIRRRATAAVTSALAAATVLAALVVAAPTPAGAAPRQPADPTGAFLLRGGRFTPWGHPRRRRGGPPQPQQPRPGVGAYLDAKALVRSFVKDRQGRVTTFAVPGAAATLARGHQRPRPGRRHLGRPSRDPDRHRAGHAARLVWDRGRLTRFDVPGSLATGALGINNHGQVTGADDDAAGRHHGFVLRRGRYATIAAPGRTVPTPGHQRPRPGRHPRAWHRSDPDHQPMTG